MGVGGGELQCSQVARKEVRQGRVRGYGRFVEGDFCRDAGLDYEGACLVAEDASTGKGELVCGLLSRGLQV